MKKILAIGAHCDDIELGCGATLAKLIKEGAEVKYIAFSICKIDSLADECYRATKELGIREAEILFFSHRTLHERRQDVLGRLIEFRDSFKPDTIFTHSSASIHQDHQVVHQESIRAFKGSVNIFGYEDSWNYIQQEQELNCLSQISEAHLETKIRALSHYKSQSHRAYMNPDFIRSLAVVRGVQFGLQLAEAMSVIRTTG